MHEEKAPFSGPIIALMLGSIALLGLASVLSFAGIYEPAEAFDVLALTTVIIAMAALSFFNMRFRVTNEGVKAVMFPFSHRVAYDNIREVHVIDKIPWYVGWG
ncbi:hypothetical protein KKA03_01935, partial [archaeon]|nr:hypothetical protein [archaeon]